MICRRANRTVQLDLLASGNIMMSWIQVLRDSILQKVFNEKVQVIASYLQADAFKDGT